MNFLILILFLLPGSYAERTTEGRQEEAIISVNVDRSTALRAAPAPAAAPASSSKLVESSAPSSERLAPNVQQEASPEQDDKSTTAADQTATTLSGHETVYSDQRFANLFARRNNLKKSKLDPTEQVKAKPTLPSFIKSPPDPKQFSGQALEKGEQQAVTTNVRASATPSSSLAFGSQRLSNQSGRLNQQQQQRQKAAAITSTSAANANNKRTNVISNNNGNNNGRQTNAKALASSLSSASNSAKSPAKLTSSPASNNPFNKSQANGSNSDPANVIAMARKRLLAQNANESAKLKLQQQSKPTSTAP